jgi:phytoene dehydrogenase-like protein
LSGKPQWAARESLADFAYVHIAPYIQDLAQTYAASLNGYLPESPLLVVGQTSVVDPSRAPGDQQVLWIQVRALPAQVKGDMAGEIEALEWDEIKEAYADRVLEKLEQYAPGVRGLILDRAVFSPIDLQRHDPNLHGGDSVSGSHHLRQNFLWRPVPGWADYRMPLEGLYMVGAATWPGAGTNAISGYLAARQILGEKPVREKLLRGGLVAGSAAAIAIAIARLIGEQEDGDGARKR